MVEENQPKITEGEPDRSTQPVDRDPAPRLSFPVVGIGASAGGIEACNELLGAMRADSGMAFVLVQHLAPDRKSMIAEILTRRTEMPVLQVEDGMQVQPNHVYVIRPGHTLTIKDGHLHLGETTDKPGRTRPVDDFFKSLAEEQHERAICIIMSGMGSNGTAGAQAIKAVGGLCIAQEPESAQFSSMPQHLIDAGYADYILRPQDMPDVLLAYINHPYAKGQESAEQLLRGEQQHLREIMAVLRTRVRQDFSGYKKPTVLRRIQRRMGLNRVTKIGEYAKLLRQSPTEVAALADDLLIHVTGFFRDADAWESLRQNVIVPLIGAREPDSSIRAWVAACSSGEEAYTLAMLLTEEAERISKPLDIKVFATDTAERSLVNARHGVYPGGIESEISPRRLERFFQREDAVYRIRPDLRERVVFAPQNLLQDPPFSRLDIATCRNLLIYLEPDAQSRAISLLHFGLRDGGTLFLGSSETVAGLEEMFEPIDKKARIYRRIGPTRHGTVEFPPMRALTGNEDRLFAEARPVNRQSIAHLTHTLLLQRYTPAAVTVDREHRIVYFHGNTSKFLNQPQGEATRDVLAMARDTVRGAVRTALQRAISQHASVSVLDGWVEHEAGRRTRVTITASPLDQKAAPDFFLISFEEHREVSPPPPDGAAEAGRNQGVELRRVRDELQSAVEELQSSNEELQASNEEVMSVNEELQSANEELETSKEEMQSLNEELTTVNAQLQAKIEDHQSTTNDLSSLLASTSIAVIFLDTHFRIRRYTPAVKDLLELISSDVGRPLSDLAKKFSDPDLLKDGETVLANLTPIEKEIPGEAGRWYMRRVLPYRTTDNRIDGVVITFVDITQRRKSVEALKQNEERLRRVIAIDTVGIIFFDNEGRIVDCNDAFLEITGFTRREVGTDDMVWKNLLPPESSRQSEDAEISLRRNGRIKPYEKQFIRLDGSRWWGLCAGQRLDDQTIVKYVIDVSERRTEEEAHHETQARYRLAIDAAHLGFWEWNVGDGTIHCDATTNRLLGLPRERAQHVYEQFGHSIHPDDLPRVVAGQRQALENKADFVAEFRVNDPDGTTRWLSSFGRPIVGEGGKVKRMIGGIVDISVRKEADAERVDLLKREQTARAQAEAANNMKDQFLATLGHELRAPLSAILLWAKILQAAPPDGNEQLKEGLAAIRTSADAQKELIEDLLDVARITAGKLRLQMREVELETVVQAAVDTIMPTAEVKGVSLELDLDGKTGVVRADADRLRQVVWNLLINAVKFTPAGGRIDVQIRRRAGGVEIRVADTGRGISKELLPRIFDRFEQSEGAQLRGEGGLGLGLTISRQLVELHGGTIAAVSPGLGKGSTFTVNIPLPRVRSARAHAPGEKPTRGVPEKGSLSGEKVLLVEDAMETLRAMTVLLEGAGAEVTAVASATEAFAVVEKNAPSLIVSDIGLPGEDGHSLLRRIRARETAMGLPRVPAVAISAFTRDQDRAQSLAAGFDEHFAKPVDADQLLVALGKLRD